MHRIVSSIVLLFSCGILLSCSGTGQTTQKSDSQTMEAQQYPSWYPNQKVVSNKTQLLAYATAVGKDSVSSVSKAIAWAESELKTSVSDRLESIRSEALVEQGSGSGLDDAQFLIALRKVDRAVNPLVETGRTVVKTVEGYSSVRSFAEVSVPKDQLIERIGKRLAGYEQAWNTMKESKAFKNF